MSFGIGTGTSSWPHLSLATSAVVNFLGAGQEQLARTFATSGIDRFAAGGWSALETGEPVIDEAVSWLQGRVVQRVPVGGSYLVSVRALAHSVADDALPLVYHDRTYHRIGDHTAV